MYSVIIHYKIDCFKKSKTIEGVRYEHVHMSPRSRR